MTVSTPLSMANLRKISIQPNKMHKKFTNELKCLAYTANMIQFDTQ